MKKILLTITLLSSYVDLSIAQQQEDSLTIRRLADDILMKWKSL